MSYNKNYKNLLLIISVLSAFFPNAFSAIDQNNYSLGSTCLNKTNKLSNHVFHHNLEKVMKQLNLEAPSPRNKNIGFYYFSWGGGGADTAYGLAQCRQDITPSDCMNCVTTAIKDLHTLCPKEREAIIWYNLCMIKYDDVGFLGNLDTSKGVYVNQYNSPLGGPDFPKTAKQLMDQLCSNVIHAKMYLFYSTTAINGNLYGMSQCNRDIDQADCYKCIKTAADSINSEINGYHKTCVGQRYAYVSCSIRFDNYAFF